MTAVGRVAAIGESVAVQGFGLAGALVLGADEPDAVRGAWRSLPDDVAVVVLTPAAADALSGWRGDVAWPLTVVMPP